MNQRKLFGGGLTRARGPMLGCRAGTATIEFAFVASILLVLFLNLFDVSMLVWSQMQVDNAAEVGAQAAYANCAGSPVPTTTNCKNMTSDITNAIQSTSLGTNVSLSGGAPTETYYCLNGSNALVSVGS